MVRLFADNLLPVFLAAYLVLPFRNFVLLAASLFFYAWGELGYVFLLLGSIALNWAVGLGIAHFCARGARGARAMLGAGIAGNLLCFPSATFGHSRALS